MTDSLLSSSYKFSFTLALLASFFVANAAQAETLFGPANAIVGKDVEYSTNTFDASSYENLFLNFNYMAEKLDDKDSFTYGWRVGGAEVVIDTFAGLPDGQLAIPGDETGVVNVGLPQSAAVSELEVFVRVTADSTIGNDFVDISELMVTGDHVVLDADADGVIEGDYCDGTKADEAERTTLNPNHWRYDGTYWTKALARGLKGNSSAYTMSDTRGCSCDQMLDVLQSYTGEDYGGQRKYGCTSGTIEKFMELVW